MRRRYGSSVIGMRLAAAAVIVVAAGSEAHAQTLQDDGRIVYPVAWFAAYSPADALDMAEQVPGFRIEDGADVRGFGGAAGNVVINGARPSIKADTLAEVLRRIPASQVVRMELAPGRLLGSEYQSRSQVLNVVLIDTAVTALSGNVEAGASHVYSGRVTPFINGSILARRGEHTFNGGLRYDARTMPDGGWDLATRGDGSLIERRDKENRYAFREITATGGWQWKQDDQTSNGVNARLWDGQNPLRHISHVTGPSGLLRFDTIDQHPEWRGLELGANAMRPVAGGVGRLVLLARRELYDFEESSLNFALSGDLTGGFRQVVGREWGEALARFSWTRSDLMGWSVEAGGEMALNTLENDVALARVAASGAETPIALPIEQVEVRELRNELFASASRALTSRLSLETALAVEQSSLTVDGDATADRELIFLKPRVALEWRPDSAWRLRGGLERRVSQLNFLDFATNAELANGRVSSGNPDIEPERTWRLSALMERKVWGDGQLRLTIYSDWVEQVQDRVPTALGFDAPGNLGDGRRTGFDFVADLPLDRLFVPGGRFNLRWVVQDSDVEDPYTGLGRYFSSEVPWTLTASIRQNLPQHDLAWGVDYFGDGENASYRLNEVDRFNTENLNVGAFVEYRPTQQVIATLSVRNIFDRVLLRDRAFFSPDRSSVVPVAFEHRYRTFGRTWTVTIKRTFG